VPFYAHSENGQGVKHDLVSHLKSVAELAAEFTGKFGAADFGYWAGLWHDLGKFNPEFQSYIASPEGHRGPDHSSAGAIHAVSGFEGLAFLVAGHHAGLPNRTDLKNRIREKSGALQVRTALELARQELTQVTPEQPLIKKLPDFLMGKSSRASESEQLSRKTELFLRMVFSGLVDADFLDTEAHFDKERSSTRSGAPCLEELWRRFESDQASISGQRDDRLNRFAMKSISHASRPQMLNKEFLASQFQPEAGKPVQEWRLPCSTQSVTDSTA